jgi:asparagine synthase (glutamine-hydrolysing)
MCGIAGFAGPDPELLDRMLTSIVHRGPDGSGTEVNDHWSLGMRRLAIIDPEAGKQPIYTDAGTCIVFNGEIYNAPELRPILEGKGHRFSTDHSDTEVILRGYEEWGARVVDHLIGMFAFAIWDPTRGELFIARDRLGIKPLYYTIDHGRFAFASELKALFQDPSVSRAPDADAVYKFLLFRVHDDTEATFFASVKRLLPGHTMTIGRDGARKIEQYWSPVVNPEFSSSKSDAEYAAEFADRFETVVRRHLLSDAPVGVPLSGGLDSSGVVCTMASLMQQGADLHTGGALHTFSAIYPGQSIDESEYIHEVERYVGSTPHYSQPHVDEFWAEIMEWIWFQEEPTIASAPYAYYSVYRLASEHVKVMLSGNGGDELLAGYIPYFRAYLTSAIDQKHYGAGAREIAQGFDLYRKFIGDELRSKLPGRPKPPGVRSLLEGEGRDLAHYSFTPSRNLNERLAGDVLATSTPNLLRYEDKNSMAFSIEARVPFLDHELVEYIFALPIDQKIKGGWNRAVYRNAMKGRMPEKNRLRRSKIGFTNPEITWARARSASVAAIFQSPEFRGRGLWNAPKIAAEFDRWVAGGPGEWLTFWRILVTELWMQRYMDQSVMLK